MRPCVRVAAVERPCACVLRRASTAFDRPLLPITAILRLLPRTPRTQFALRLGADAKQSESEDDHGKIAAVALMSGTIPPLIASLPSGLRVYWVHGTHDAVHNSAQARRDAARLDELEGIAAEFRQVPGTGSRVWSGRLDGDGLPECRVLVI